MPKQIQETEMAVVCALLLSRNNLPEVAGWLTPEMFATPELAFAYTAILAQYDRGEKPDILTTDTEMLRTDTARYEAMNGTAYLAEGMKRMRHSENLVAYAREVKRRYLLRRMEKLFGSLKMKASSPETDCSELVSEAENALLGIREVQVIKGEALRPLARIAEDTLSFHLSQMKQERGDGYVLTGFDEFDRLTGGMHPGELFVGGGRPGDGKSAVAMQIGLNAALAGKSVCFFSLEMTETQVMNRFFAGQTGVEAARLRVSKLTSGEIGKMEQLAKEWENLPFFLDYMAVNNVENIRAQVLLQQRRGRCDLVVVDYLHMLEYKPRKGETLEQVIARHVRVLKALAKEANCPVLLLSQMNRASENRPDKSHMPVLSDLRDSGTIEQVADCVFFVYRPERHGITKDERTGESLEGIAKLVISKHRNGNTGIARVRHNTTFTKLTGYDNQLALI